MNCKYCGKSVMAGDMCDNCRQKQPIVKKLVALFQVIKDYYGLNKK